MITNFSAGEIWKGSNAQITVALFPICYQRKGEITDVVLSFYTTIGGTAVVFSGSSVAVDNNYATVVFQPVQLDVFEDGLLRYQVNLNDNGAPKIFNLETRFVIKTPLDYEPVDYVTHSEVDEAVDEYLEDKMGDYYTSAQTDTKITDAIATETARTENTYLKEHQSLADYYTSAQTNSAIETAIEAQSATTSAQTEELISEAMAAETARTEQTYLKEHQSLADYYTSAQTNSAIETAIEAQSATTSAQTEELITEAIAQETARTESTYLKEHQSLEDYYTSAQTNSAIETAMAAETARTEQTYLKEHQSLADYYTSAQTDSAITTSIETAMTDVVTSTTIDSIVTCTQAQYDVMTAHTNNILYFING